jgi:N-acetylmuramoyl-L-alanine amidase
MTQIIIDAGHGGSIRAGNSSAFGARGGSGTLEKDVTLDIARHVVARLGGRAALTRSTDANQPLGARAQKAARDGADVFVSIHANSGPPEASGPETFVHSRSGAASHRLAGCVQQALEALHGRYGSPNAPKPGPMAVLAPELVGARTAACLVEVDYLSHPRGEQRLRDPNERALIGAAIARAIEDHISTTSTGYLGNARAEAAGDSGGYFTDTDQLDAYMRDSRAGDTAQVSTVADGQAIVDQYLARGGRTVWPNIDVAACAQQIKDRCANHRLFQQGNLNLCGPAVFLHIWAGRDPVGYARYAVGMLETGEGRIGSTAIRATSALEVIRYPALGRPSAMTAPAADFVCMAPLRNDANAILPYDPASAVEGLEGLTTPGEVAGWLRATGVFSTVRDEGNWITSAGLEHATGLLVGTGSDVAVLINVSALAGATKVEAVETPNTPITNPMNPDRSFILNMFPNHFVSLLAGLVVSIDRTTVSLSAWTWGGSYVFSGIPVGTFSDNYYGAVKTSVRQ